MNTRGFSKAVEVAKDSGELQEVDTDQKDVVFETRRSIYFVSVPIIWIITVWVVMKKAIYWLGGFEPMINSLWFDGLGPSCRQIKESATSWKALDVTYNPSFKKGIRGLIDAYWLNMLNPQAVRNRLRLAKQEIKSAVLKFDKKEEVRILSLAAGSAQGVIEVMAELKQEGIRVRALLLDHDEKALFYAKELAFEHGVHDQIDTVKATAAKVARVSRDFHPDLVEMIGLLDYLNQYQAIKLVGKIHDSLESGGFFLTCNIRPNPEMYFLKWVINWDMIYRSPDELSEIIIEAGFDDYKLAYEPLKIHGLVVAQKA